MDYNYINNIDSYGGKYIMRKYGNTIPEDIVYSRYHMCNKCNKFFTYRLVDGCFVLEDCCSKHNYLKSPLIDGSGALCPYCGNGHLFPIDDNMIYPIIELNKKGYRTMFCCEGHVPEVLKYDKKYRNVHTYISFQSWAMVPDKLPDTWVSGIDEIRSLIAKYEYYRNDHKFDKEKYDIANRLLNMSWITSRSIENRPDIRNDISSKFMVLDDLYHLVDSLQDISEVDLNSELITSDSSELSEIEKVLCCIVASFLYTKLVIAYDPNIITAEKRFISGVSILFGVYGNDEEAVFNLNIYASRSSIFLCIEPTRYRSLDGSNYAALVSDLNDKVKDFRFKFESKGYEYMHNKYTDVVLERLMNHDKSSTVNYDSVFLDWMLSIMSESKKVFPDLQFNKIASFGIPQNAFFAD